MSQYQLFVRSNSLSLQLRSSANAWTKLFFGGLFVLMAVVMASTIIASWSGVHGFWKHVFIGLCLILCIPIFVGGCSQCRQAWRTAVSAGVDIRRSEANEVVVQVEVQFFSGRKIVRSIDISNPQQTLASAERETIYNVRYGGHSTRHYLCLNLAGPSGQAYYRVFNDLNNGPTGMFLRENEAASIVKLMNGFAARGYAAVGELSAAERDAAGVFA